MKTFYSSGIFVFAEKLYKVDEALLASMDEKHRILSEDMERLEKESQTVRSIQIRAHRMFI